jgi:hypothetical protein
MNGGKKEFIIKELEVYQLLWIFKHYYIVKEK